MRQFCGDEDDKVPISPDQQTQIDEIKSNLETAGYKEQDNGSLKDSGGNTVQIEPNPGSINITASHEKSDTGASSEKANVDAKNAVEKTLTNTTHWETGAQGGDKVTHFQDSHRGPEITISHSTKNDK
ncbi:MAG TPA: hypothetical protein PKM84_02775 [Candidatus Pacearchaeota archaeon]|nr:hypothetical protein [Candidatus Pacearchaeota archaeon]